MSTAKSENTTSVIKEITPLSEGDCFYIADRHKKEFTYPIHKHVECELEFLSNAAGFSSIGILLMELFLPVISLTVSGK